MEARPPRVYPPHQLALIWSRHLKIPSTSHISHVLFLSLLALPLHHRPGEMETRLLEMFSKELERALLQRLFQATLEKG